MQLITYAHTHTHTHTHIYRWYIDQYILIYWYVLISYAKTHTHYI